MPPPPTENALFIIRPKYKKAAKTITLIFDRGTPIKQFMSSAAKLKLGLNNLTDQQWADFDAFLDPNKVLAPGDPPH
jgi:hypothetical protein